MSNPISPDRVIDGIMFNENTCECCGTQHSEDDYVKECGSICPSCGYEEWSGSADDPTAHTPGPNGYDTLHEYRKAALKGLSEGGRRWSFYEGGPEVITRLEVLVAAHEPKVKKKRKWKRARVKPFYKAEPQI